MNTTLENPVVPSSSFELLNEIQADFDNPTEVFLTVEEVQGLRPSSQKLQAEGRKGEREGVEDIAVVLNRAKLNGKLWPIQTDKMVIAIVDEKPRLLGGFKRCVALTQSNYEKADLIPVEFYGEVSESDAVALAGIDNFHLGDKETPLQRAMRARTMIALDADVDETLNLLCLTESSYNQYKSQVKGMSDVTRKALAGGALSDGQAKAITWLEKAEECSFKAPELITKKDQVVSMKAMIEKDRKDVKAAAEASKGDSASSTVTTATTTATASTSKPVKPEAPKVMTVEDRANQISADMNEHFKALKSGESKVKLVSLLSVVLSELDEIASEQEEEEATQG